MQTVRMAWPRKGAFFRTVLARTVGMLVLWIILSGSAWSNPGVIILGIAGASLASIVLVPSSQLRWTVWGTLRFIPFFLVASFLGGVDVARRAMLPRMPLDSHYVRTRLRLRPQAARVLTANIMSLMPGTLAVELEQDCLELHVLDRSMPAASRVQQVEAYVARMCGVPLCSARPPQPGRR